MDRHPQRVFAGFCWKEPWLLRGNEKSRNSTSTEDEGEGEDIKKLEAEQVKERASNSRGAIKLPRYLGVSIEEALR